MVLRIKLKDVRDEQSEYEERAYSEEWEGFDSPKEELKSAISTNVWNYVRRNFKVRPKKLGKEGMRRLMFDLAYGRSPKGYKLPPRRLAEGKVMARRLVIDKRTGRTHGAWEHGLYEHLSSIHTSRSRTGSAYTRTYKRWSAAQERVAVSPVYTMEEKVKLTGHTRQAIDRKSRRFRGG